MKHNSTKTINLAYYPQLVVLCVLMLIITACGSPPEGVSCSMDSHQNGDDVIRYETLTGSVDSMQSKWYLFAYTRAQEPNAPYWRSDKGAVIIGSDWTVDVIYGNETTSAGTKFETILIVTTDRNPPSQVEQVSDIQNSVSCAKVTLQR